MRGFGLAVDCLETNFRFMLVQSLFIVIKGSKSDLIGDDIELLLIFPLDVHSTLHAQMKQSACRAWRC